MDEELRTYLREMEGRLTGRIDGLDQRIAKTETNLVAMEERIESRFDAKIDDALTHWSRHLLQEMGSRFGEMNNRFEFIDSRLKLQAGLIQSGARAMARFSSFSENSEERWVELDHHVAEIERRLSPK